MLARSWLLQSTMETSNRRDAIFALMQKVIFYAQYMSYKVYAILSGMFRTLTLALLIFTVVQYSNYNIFIINAAIKDIFMMNTILLYLTFGVFVMVFIDIFCIGMQCYWCCRQKRIGPMMPHMIWFFTRLIISLFFLIRSINLWFLILISSLFFLIRNII